MATPKSVFSILTIPLMHYYSSLEEVNLKDVWLSIGSFDGVHLGHQAIIHHLINGAKKNIARPCVLTFDPHPAIVLGKRQWAQYLTTARERAKLLGDLGVDSVIVHTFNLTIAQMTARDFIKRLLIFLEVKQLVVGCDFALGKNREGDVKCLTALGEEYGYQVQAVSPVKFNGNVISSSRVRSLLSEGDVISARRLLGRPYSLWGKVVTGDGRGHAFRIPTANLDVWLDRAIPKDGVYVCRVMLDNYPWGAVANIGHRPTFGIKSNRALVEVHLFDFQGNIYGKDIQVEFIERLREERKFSDVSLLIGQINEDIIQAKAILASQEIL